MSSCLRYGVACISLGCVYTRIGKRYIASNFNCRIETEGLLKVTGSHVNCKGGNVSETAQNTGTLEDDY